MMSGQDFYNAVEVQMRNRTDMLGGGHPMNYHDRMLIESIGSVLQMVQMNGSSSPTFVSPHHQELMEMRAVFEKVQKIFGNEEFRRAIADTEAGISNQIREMKKSLFDSFGSKLNEHIAGSRGEFDKLFDTFEKKMHEEIAGTHASIDKKGRALIEEMKQHSEAFMKELEKL